jgi:Profilin
MWTRPPFSISREQAVGQRQKISRYTSLTHVSMKTGNHATQHSDTHPRCSAEVPTRLSHDLAGPHESPAPVWPNSPLDQPADLCRFLTVITPRAPRDSHCIQRHQRPQSRPSERPTPRWRKILCHKSRREEFIWKEGALSTQPRLRPYPCPYSHDVPLPPFSVYEQQRKPNPDSDASGFFNFLFNQGKEGAVIVKTKQALLITHYPETVQPGQAATTVEKLGDYLITQSY